MMQSVPAAFEQLLLQHRNAIRVHCYRMLGSSHDGDDMVQETFVRAVRAKDSLQHPGAARAWLHRIATNVCLDELQKRGRRVRGPELGPPMEPDAPTSPELPDATFVEPMPGAWLEGVATDPGALYTARESVALAFVAALQVLTPAQRAVLLLREVVGLSAEETASALECSPSAANSALHRARSALEERVGRCATQPVSEREATSIEREPDRALLERYLEAWNSGQPERLVALLREDATMSMPPHPSWLLGRVNIGRFFALRQHSCMRGPGLFARLIPVNDGAGLALYRDPERASELVAIHALELRDGSVQAIDHFVTNSGLVAFATLAQSA